MNKIYKVSVKITGFGFGVSENAYEEVKPFEGDMYFRNKYLADKYIDEIYRTAEKFQPSYYKYGKLEITNYGNYSVYVTICSSIEEFRI